MIFLSRNLIRYKLQLMHNLRGEGKVIHWVIIVDKGDMDKKKLSIAALHIFNPYY